MIICGIDPSSSKTGVAFFNGRKLVKTVTWEKDKTKSLQENLFSFYCWLSGVFQENGPVDETIVETAHSRILNVNTFKKIAYYEAASMLCAIEEGSKVKQLSASQSRKISLGNGRMSKDEACAAIDHMFPGRQFASKDERDAVVLAMAALKSL